MNTNTIIRHVVGLGVVALFTVPAGMGVFGTWNVAYSGDGPALEGDAARGARAWAQNCMRCHNARDPKEFRDDLWKPIVYHMRVRAGLTGQDTRDILKYIQESN